jgi:hypothetical protein
MEIVNKKRTLLVCSKYVFHFLEGLNLEIF